MSAVDKVLLNYIAASQRLYFFSYLSPLEMFFSHNGALEKISVDYLSNAATTALALRLFRSVYVCPVPTKTIGCPVV